MKAVLDNLIERYPALACCREQIEKAADILVECYRKDGKLLTAGNGGSAADAEHIVGEMMKTFCYQKTLPEGYAEALYATDPEMGNVLASHLQGALPAWGDSTENAMRLGAKYGHRGMVREILAFIRERTGPDTFFCATGGYAAWALEGIEGCSIEPDLTLFGLGSIWSFSHPRA